jgi:hypothetical protein
VSVVNSAVIQWFRGLWRFYLTYTKTGVHAAATAGLAIFGLLMFVDDTFVVFAIASYVLPPMILYALADEPRDEDVRDERPADTDESTAEAVPARDATRLAEGTTTVGGAGEVEKADRSATGDESRSTDGRENGDTDSDRDDGDTDFDSDDGDTDSDSDDGDTDSDSDDGDTDSDSDDGDTDSDSDDGDTDSDSDDGDTDSDSDS